MTTETLTQKYLKEIYSYCEETGIFTRIKTTSNVCKVGESPKTVKDNGYLQMNLNKKHYYAHRLAWLYVYGVLPKQIDHINHNRLDNRICNLRSATSRINAKNKSRLSNNKSGVTGVFWLERTKSWASNIKINGRKIHIGYFKNFNDAIIARKMKEYELGFHANHGE